MKPVVFMVAVGLVLGAVGFSAGRYTKPIPQPLVTSIIQAAFSDSNISSVSVDIYQGKHQYIWVRTMVEIPKPEFRAKVFRVSDQGMALLLPKQDQSNVSQLRIEGEPKLRRVDSVASILISHLPCA